MSRLETKQAKLHDRLYNEFSKYLERLKQTNIDYVLDKHYEITIKEELTFIPYDLSESIIDTINKEHYKLQDLYDIWLRSDYGINSDITTSIEEELE